MSEGINAIVAGGMILTAYVVFVYLPTNKRTKRGIVEKQKAQVEPTEDEGQIDFYGVQRLANVILKHYKKVKTA